MSRRTVLFLSGGGYHLAWQALSMGLTAAAMGDEVVLVWAFDALQALAAGRFGAPVSDAEAAAVARGEALGAATPARMLEDARALGVRLVACDTTVGLTGLQADALEAEGTLDEVLGLPQIWKLVQGAATVLRF